MVWWFPWEILYFSVSSVVVSTSLPQDYTLAAASTLCICLVETEQAVIQFGLYLTLPGAAGAWVREHCVSCCSLRGLRHVGCGCWGSSTTVIGFFLSFFKLLILEHF